MDYLFIRYIIHTRTRNARTRAKLQPREHADVAARRRNSKYAKM